MLRRSERRSNTELAKEEAGEHRKSVSRTVASTEGQSNAVKDEDDLYAAEMESPPRLQPSHTRLRNLLSLWRLIPFSLIR